jgi:putative polyketide hydroxylase
MSPTRVPVLIVGSGLAGLTTAVMLAWRGIRPLLVERHADTSKNPRARGGNMNDFSIIVAEAVTGRELKTILPRGSYDTTDLTPAQMSGAGQDRIEPILRRHAEALGADIRYSTELSGFEQDAAGVTATLRDLRTGQESQVRADYMVAGDGNRRPHTRALRDRSPRRRQPVTQHGHGIRSQPRSGPAGQEPGALLPAEPGVHRRLHQHHRAQPGTGLG